MMGTFQICGNTVKGIFRVPSNCFRQIRSITVMHQFKVNNAIKYPKRDTQNLQRIDKMVRQREKLRTDRVTRTIDRRNYYSALGVDKNASLKEIRRAYYFLAKKFHPDSSKVFKLPQSDKIYREITEAYNILTDENKRREYDTYGIVKSLNISKSKTSEENNKKEDNIFEAPGNKSKSDSHEPSHPIKVPNENTLKVSFVESVRGTTKDFNIRTIKPCPVCSGSIGSSIKKNMIVCDKCNGSGLQPIISSTGNIVRGSCLVCRGRRYVPQHKCLECAGRGIIVANKQVEVVVPPGADTGDVVKVQHPINGQQIAVRIQVAEDDRFNRVGNAIYSELPVTLSQAVLGGVITVKGVSNDHKIVLEPGTESGTQIRLIGKGVRTKSSAGDLIFTVRVKIPKMLTTKQKALMAAFAEIETEGPDRKAELRRTKIKDELANLHSLNRFSSALLNSSQKPSEILTWSKLSGNSYLASKTM